MPWFNATSVSVTNGATVVSVNAGDDISLAQAAGGLIIGTQPAVEIKRTFLDGSNNKKIELLKPWPYGSQTNQPAVAFPTDGDLAAATAVLKQLIEGFTLATQADAEGGSETTRPMTALRVKQAMDKLLGTASKLTATTSSIDSTRGRALRAGDAGVGAMLDFRGIFNNFDTPQKCWGRGTLRGFLDGETLGIPGFQSTSYGVLEINGQYSDRSGGAGVNQRFMHDGLTLTRLQLSDTTWTPWFVSSAPIVGNVAFAAGLSTGSIIERGSNSNGEYVKLADGLMNAVFSRTAPITMTPYGSVPGIYAGSFVWTFPSAFTAAGSIVVTGVGADQSAVGWIGAIVTTGSTATVVYFSATQNVTAMNVCLAATGRWR